MIFSSKAFFIFLPIVLFLYHIQRDRDRKYLTMLIASWLFYMWWSVWYIWVIWFLTVIDYQVGKRIEDAGTDREKRWWLKLSILSNLGLLAGFKYTVFVLENTCALASMCGIPIPTLTLKILLPLGISFHTFQGISYTIDVYRGHIKAVRNPIDYAMFVAFFPQLAAGPIVRAVEFLPQMVTPPKVTADDVQEGLHWFLSGLFKKIVIADRLAMEIVDPVFKNPGMYDSFTHRWAIIAWMCQIYCDFSGYSDMAIGCARWFGFRLPRNFDFPYLATSMTEFWRRWHLSLSTWLRDYLYFPLGGSRGSGARTYFNLMVLFLLTGLWHGASWNWLAYGLLMGTLVCLHRVWTRNLDGIEPLDAVRRSWAYLMFAWAATMWQLCVGLVLVRMQSWSGGWLLQGSLCGIPHMGQTLVPACVPLLVGCVAVGHAFSGLRGKVCGILEMPSILRAGAYVACVGLIVTCSAGVGAPFIYFDF